MQNIVFIPMEIKSRELDSRLLIALNLVKNGVSVFLGEKNKINQAVMDYKNAIYLAKSGATVDQAFFKQLKAKGHKIAVLDEEAIIHQNESAHVRSRFSKEAISMVDCFFSWGEYDNSVAVSAFPEEAEKFALAGNPRMDLLRKELRTYYQKPTEELNAAYGNFLFIPSSFAMCNHFTESGARIEWRREMGMISNEADVIFYQSYVDHFESIFRSFLEAVPKLASKYSDRMIIVRPHPSENRKVWEDALENIPNVKVISEGPIAPWLMASDLVIHNGCTTAIEAFLLDRNVIAYRPFTSNDYDLKIPNDISMQAFDFDGLVTLMDRVLVGGPSEGYATNGRKVLGKYIHSLEGDFAFETIARSIRLISPDSDASKQFNFMRSLKRVIRNNVANRKRPDYSKQKFPELTKDEISSLIDRYSEIVFGTNNFSVRKKDENLFLLS